MKRFLIFVTLFLSTTIVSAQQQGVDALKADYPLLMEKFGAELESQRADYIFAIDVSGTMSKYKETVVPALGEFFRSLQEGDYVSIIKFGGEATNEVGSAGKIEPETVKNLISYAGRIYDKPTTEYEREKYFRYTDLENMLRYLATDMKQIGRSQLKFVFIITDFLHDPSSARKGKEDWAGVAKRFATEQAGNDVFVFALQLPGSGRDLEKVRGVFPKSFGFNHVPITSGSALSTWFTQRKNAILLDKFYALVSHKIQPDNFAIVPSIDVEGRLELNVSWLPNPVYDQIRVDSIGTTASGFDFNSMLPKSTTDGEACMNAGKFNHWQARLLTPSFRKLSGDVVAYASFDEPYNAELSKLGIAAPKLQAKAPIDRTVFCYPLPLWLCCLIVVLIIIYIILAVRAFLRNRSDFYRISGRFKVVECDGRDVAGPMRARALDKVDIGRGASFLMVEDANWTLQIEVKRWNPFLRPLKHPQYVVHLLRGASFRIGTRYGSHQHPSIARGAGITVDNHSVRWYIN